MRDLLLDIDHDFANMPAHRQYYTATVDHSPHEMVIYKLLFAHSNNLECMPWNN